MQNGSTCKDKWESISGKFKKLFNPLRENKHNEHYWMMSPQDKVDLYLSILFFKKVLLRHNFGIHGGKVHINPSHVWDHMKDFNHIFLSPNWIQH
jgi:hypothetical protein